MRYIQQRIIIRMYLPIFSFLFFSFSGYSQYLNVDPTETQKIEKLADKCNMGNKKGCEKLIKIAKYDLNRYVRAAAVENLTDQAVLQDIAKNDKHEYVRRAAIMKLTDQIVLEDIALNSKDKYARMAAVEILTDEVVLGEVAKSDENFFVCSVAIRNLTDQVVIGDVALNAKDYSIRRSAAEILTNQEVLGEIAKNDVEYNVRMAATENLTDQAVLADIAIADKNYSVRLKAVKNLTDQEVLEDIAKNDFEEGIRMAAVKNLTDQYVLSEIAKSDIYDIVRLHAINEIADRSILKDLVKVSERDNRSIAEMIELKLIASDPVVESYNDSIYIEFFSRDSHKDYELGMTYTSRRYTVKVKRNSWDWVSFTSKGGSGGMYEDISELSKIHHGVIDYKRIIEYLLKGVDKAGLNALSDKCEIILLSEVLNSVIQELEGEI